MEVKYAFYYSLRFYYWHINGNLQLKGFIKQDSICIIAKIFLGKIALHTTMHTN